MKIKFSLLIVIILAIFLVGGCANTKATTNDDNKIQDTQEENDTTINKDENDEENNDMKDNENEEDNTVNNDENEIKKEGIISPLSGLYGPEEKVNRRPVAVMFDNHPRARWQAGLSQAEIVYEILVESYTRYMGIFLMNDPESIGPVRSARPYFITKMLEYDGVYVRCGGSEQAKADVRNLGVADVDGLATPGWVFIRYRETGKKMPHDLYSNMSDIRKYQQKRGYRAIGDFRPFKFNESDIFLEGQSAELVNIKYLPDNYTKYVYDNKEKQYYRYKDGKLHIDEIDGSKLKAKNIIIQRAKTRVIDSAGRLKINLIGSGEGYYITNGKAIKVTWEKKSRRDKTIYYDENGEEIHLNPGVTWVQVVTLNTKVNIE